MKVKSNFSFQDDYIIAFDKIITYVLRKDSSGYKLIIKQAGAVSHTEISIMMDTYQEFKESYINYLDYKLQHSMKDNEMISYFLQEKENLFNEIRENFKVIGEELKEEYRENVELILQESKDSLEEIQQNFENTIEKIERTHDSLDEEYKKLSKINRIFDNFDVESLLDTEAEVKVKEGDLIVKI